MIYFSPCSSFSPLNRTGNGENDGKPEQLNPLFQHIQDQAMPAEYKIKAF